ncbi:PH domain-containing protein [Nonomuraea sp. NPDC002799]
MNPGETVDRPAASESGMDGPAASEPAVDRPPDPEPAADQQAAPEPGADRWAGIPWSRLSSRVAWVDAVRLVLTIIPSVLVTVVFGRGLDAWPILVATAIGALATVMDFRRWVTTRYRVTPDRVEIRRGWLVRRSRSVPRDRIRTADTSAKLRHKLAGLRVVHLSSGEAGTSFKLDAVTSDAAERLRDELLGLGGAEQATDHVTGQAADEDVIARFRWSWFLYNVISIWAFLAAALFLWSSYMTLQMFDVDLREILAGAVGWESLGTGWSIAVGAAGCFVVGTIGLMITFLKEKWNFQLVRTATEAGTVLLTRQGLFQTREVLRDERRLRGIHLSEPLLSRWMRLAETEVISTGLRWVPGSDASSAILPRTSVTEARRVALAVLGAEHRPLETPLRAHPRTALYRRLAGSTLALALVAGLLAWLGARDAIPGALWQIPLWLLPPAWALAVVAYRSLGHARAGPYLVSRSGVIRRATVALQCRGVIGWTLSQSLFQRLLGLTTVRVTTAAGARFYEIPDFAADEAVTFAHDATPRLLAEFLVPDAEPPAATGN